MPKAPVPKAPTEITLLDIIKSVLPDGTVDSTGWNAICEWPPDLFAAVATITEHSGLYSDRIFTAYWADNFELTADWIAKVRKIGNKWAVKGTPPREASGLWSNLIRRHGDAPVADSSTTALAWKKIVFSLLVIADEACGSIGFSP